MRYPSSASAVLESLEARRLLADIWVSTTADSGPGSFRAAIEAANATVEHDVISFAIAGSGVQTIRPLTPLPLITQPVTIDGYTQTGASPNTRAVGNDVQLRIELDGAQLPPASTGIVLVANDSVIRGLVVNSFPMAGLLIAGERNQVSGSFIGTDFTGNTRKPNLDNGIFVSGTDNLIGGATPAERNVVSGNGRDTYVFHGGIQVNGLRTRVLGNYIGTNAAGTQALGNLRSGISVNSAGTDVQIGGPLPGERNVISGSHWYGIAFNGASGKIQGNYIGTNATGTAAIPNLNTGLAMLTGATQLGGSAPGEGNIIAGNSYGGAWYGHSTSGVVQGNVIGSGVGGVALPQAGPALSFIGGSNVLVGGRNPGEANQLNNCRNEQGVFPTVMIRSSSTGVRVIGNSMADTAFRGIHLGDWVSGQGYVLTPNDYLDADTGPNGMQNFPSITFVSYLPGGRVRVQGQVNSLPNTDFEIDFYGARYMAFTSGEALPERHLGYGTVRTDADGYASFRIEFEASILMVDHIVATLTGPDGTSPASRWVQPERIGDMNGDFNLNNLDIAAFILALTNPDLYDQTYGYLDRNLQGDFNGDGQLNNLDIQPFIDALTGTTSGRPSVGMPTRAPRFETSPFSKARLGVTVFEDESAPTRATIGSAVLP